MTTAIIGVGRIGSTLARHLVRGGEQVVLAASNRANAAGLAGDLGELASAAPVREAIAAADVVVFAVKPFEALQQLLAEHADLLGHKVVVDPSNQYNLGPNGEFLRKLPEGQTSASMVVAMLPAGARYVKAFGTLDAASLESKAQRAPRRAVLFYATDDQRAAAVIERLITAAGFDPVKASGLKDAGRLELPDGDLHQWGGLQGALLDLDQARAAVAGFAAQKRANDG
jgi:8-hydroxy-5-deazaflavin:NADPH oxidoreductase